TGGHDHHAAADGDLAYAAADDRRRLRRPPRDERNQGDGEHGDNAAGETPAQDQANRGSLRNPAQSRQRGDADQQDAHRGDDAERRRPQMGADAYERLAVAVLLDERADVEPRTAADEDADVWIVRPYCIEW